MVIAAACLLLMAPAAGPTADEPAVRSALAKGGYPWYDAGADTLRPVEPSKEVDLPDWNLPAWIGTVLACALMGVALAALIAALVWSLRHAGSSELTRVATRRVPGSSSRVGALPPGLDLGVDDLWAEAVRRRSIGDLSGAILCVFVHQLLALEKRSILRLAPGKTARQLVRSIGPTDIRSRVEPTLRLFEIAFYGHQRPDPAAFEAAWADAEALERRFAGEARS